MSLTIFRSMSGGATTLWLIALGALVRSFFYVVIGSFGILVVYLGISWSFVAAILILMSQQLKSRSKFAPAIASISAYIALYVTVRGLLFVPEGFVFYFYRVKVFDHGQLTILGIAIFGGMAFLEMLASWLIYCLMCDRQKTD